MRGTDDLIRLCRTMGLERKIDEILAAAMPTFRPIEDPDGPHQLGGEPELAANETWPVNDNGRPLTFIAQINASRLPAHPGESSAMAAFRSRAVLLRLFADLYDNWDGYLSVSVLASHSEASRQVVPRPVFPSIGDDFEDMRISAFRKLRCDVASTWTFDPQHDSVFVEGISELREALFDVQLDGAWFTPTQLFGAPDIIQDDPRYFGASEDLPNLDDWSLLLQLDDTFADYGDGGAFFVLIPTDDLVEGRWDRLVCGSDSG